MEKIYRKRFGTTLLLSTSPCQSDLNEGFSGSKYVFKFSKENKDFKTYEEVFLPTVVRGTNVFYDDVDGNVYLTNFVFDQSLLSHPIEAITTDNTYVRMYLGKKILNFFLDTLIPEFQDEKFIYTLFGIPTPNNGQTSGTKRFAERSESVDIFASESGSIELGVHTISGSSRSHLQELENILEGNVATFSNSSSVDTQTTVPAPPLKKFKSSVLDSKITRKIEIDIFERKVRELLNDKKVSRQEIVLSPEDLILSTTHDAHDVVVSRMCQDLCGNSSLAEFDPVVVVKNYDGFRVISGSKRVAAYKISMQRKIHVCEIDEKDHDKYVLQNFFLNRGDNDVNVSFLISIVRMLLKKLELPRDFLSKWSTAEKNYVFKHLAGSLTTFRFVIDVCADAILEECILKLAHKSVDIPNHLLRDVVRKYRFNPTGTIECLNEDWSDIGSLRKAVAGIIPDLTHTLILKKVSNDVATNLARIYATDEEFTEFVKSSDLRYIKKDQQKSIISKFELFKAKNAMKPKNNTKVITGTVHDDFDLLFTTDEDLADQITSQKSSILVILLGKEARSEPCYLLIVPDAMGVEDSFGRLETHISLTFFAKKNGSHIPSDEMSPFLAKQGVRNRSVFSASQLSGVTKHLNRVYVDMKGILSTNLVLSLCIEGSTIIVSDEKEKKRLDRFMTQRHEEAAS